MEGLDRIGWHKTKVICAETEGAASFAESVKAGQHITLDKIESVASSLGARKISDKAWSYATDPRIITHICNDDTAVESCKLFFDEFRFLTEPACGAALSYVYNSNQLIDNFQKIVVIACGGSNFTMHKII
jgi:L-serine/L-threonine ammonia-lyase